MGVCGSCGMFINGRPRLACNTQITESRTNLVARAAAEFRHHPRPGARFPPMFDAHRPAPFRHRETDEESTPRRASSARPRRDEHTCSSLLHQVRLLHGRLPDLCYRPGYSGPMPLTQAHRYNVDTRDGGLAASSDERGAWARALPLRGRVLAGLPQGRGPRQGHSV